MQPLYAYLIVYAGVLVEGELALLTAALASQKGLLDIRLVVLTAFISTLTIDWLFFFTGKFLGKHILSRFPTLQKKTQKPGIWVRNNPNLILIFYRFLYGFRILTLLILGMSRVSVKKFMFYSFFVIFFWSVIFGFLGFVMGDIISNFLVEFENLGIYLATGLLVTISLLILFRNLVRKALRPKLR